jgi:hypothetical protein
MRKERETASDGPGALHRIGALGLLMTGALMATVIVIASRVPPDPVDDGPIPGVVIRTPGHDVEADPGDRLVRRARARERDRAGHGADGPRRGARTVSRAGTGGDTTKAVARPDSPPAERAPEQLAPRSGGDDDGGPPPGAGRPGGGEEEGEARAPGTGQAEEDEEGDAGDDAPAPPAPAPPPAGGGATADDDGDGGSTPSLSGTARLDDDDQAAEGIDSGEGDD